MNFVSEIRTKKENVTKYIPKNGKIYLLSGDSSVTYDIIQQCSCCLDLSTCRGQPNRYYFLYGRLEG